MHRTAKAGFSVVEILIVVLVLGILATLTYVGINNWRGRADDTTVKSELESLYSAMEDYRTWNDGYPDLASGSTFEKESSETQDIYVQGDSLEISYLTGTPGSYCVNARSNNNPDVVWSLDVSNGNKTISSGPCKPCNDGFILIPGDTRFNTDDFCVMKYEAKNNGSNVPISTHSGKPWVSINQNNAKSTSQLACEGCRLISEDEWMTIAANIIYTPSNWESGQVNVGQMYFGHSDANPSQSLAASPDDENGFFGTNNTGGPQRRTYFLSNGEVIWDMSGNVREWTRSNVTGPQPTPSENWIDWNDPSLNMNGLRAGSRPGAISSEVGSWGIAQRIGRIYSGSASGGQGFLRGGAWDYHTAAGVLTLNTNLNASTSLSNIGFRVTHPR